MVDRLPISSRLSYPYAVGYSGYIPGIRHSCGKTFGKAAEDCVATFLKQQTEKKFQVEARRAESLPRQKTPSYRMVTLSADPYYTNKQRGRDTTIHPPIPGYTGYIPRMQQLDVGRTYGSAAHKGLSDMAKLREKRRAHR